MTPTPPGKEVGVVAAPARTVRASRILRAAAYYFAIVFAVGLALGPPRVLWLEPWLGKTIAVLCEAPLLITAMWFGARGAPRWAGMREGWLAFLGVGVLALIFQQIADLAVGFGLRGMNLADQWAYFASPPGAIYAAILIIFALMPAITRLRKPSDRPGNVA
jgi:hypothetical protein